MYVSGYVFNSMLEVHYYNYIVLSQPAINVTNKFDGEGYVG